MSSRHSWLSIFCLFITLATFPAGLWVERAMTREDRAIANLVRRGASVTPLVLPDGTKGCFVALSDRVGNCELLPLVCDLNTRVTYLTLGFGRLDEACIKCLLRLKGLKALDVSYASLSDDEYARLTRELKNRNHSLIVSDDNRDRKHTW